MPTKGTSKEFLGGAIHCRKSSPYLRHLTIRYNRGQFGGGIYCHEFASPYVENCLFLENSATQSGGGLACFFYSNAVVKHNVFQANQAEEHGGGIYFSFSSPQILDNIIENNSAKFQGGGLYGSNTVTKSVSRVRGNVLLSNHAGEKAGNVYLTAKIETIFQENCLFTDKGYDVFVEALEADLDFRGNYFGPLEQGDLEARIRDRYDDPSQKLLLCDPVLETPPTGLANAPTQITSMTLHGDVSFASDWSFPLCHKAPLYVEIRAIDRNPYHSDWIPVCLHSSESDPRGIVSLAWETGPSTGIFRLRGIVEKYSSAKDAAVKAAVGEMIFITIEGLEGFEISRRIEPPQSYITAFTLPQEADSLHAVNHIPQADWRFRNIFGQPQQRYELQLFAGETISTTPLWSSGEVQDTSTSVVIKSAELKDGDGYSLRLRMNSGAEWSQWTTMSLRLNSLPSAARLQSPLGNQIITQEHPSLMIRPSEDAEGDLVLYESQLYQDSCFTRVLAIEKELKSSGAAVTWVPSIELKDDAEYFWRARARDAYETGSWAQTGHFWMNLIEEPPLPFALMDPEQDLQVFQLQPVFSWQKTVDPDPLSKVHYRLIISPDDRFLPASTIKLETDLTFLKVDRALKNDASYFWKVEAVDNTGRFMPSLTVGHISVSTTPSIPELAGPFAGEELRPGDNISWSKSTDPDPEDTVVYRVQIAEKEFAKTISDEVVISNQMQIDAFAGYAALADDKEYRLRVRAEDDQGIASAWSKSEIRFFMNKVNTPPGLVTGPIEPNGTVEINPQPMIAWSAAADADRSDPAATLSYMLQFDDGGSFREVARQVQVMAGVTRIAVPGLADNARWFYRICARDDEGALSVWSPVKSFILNTKNDPPSAPEVQPVAGGMFTGKEILSWNASTDPDPDEALTYTLLMVRSDNLETPLLTAPAISPAKATKGLTLADLPALRQMKDNERYAFRVKAVDSQSASSEWSDPVEFTLDLVSEPPARFALVSPAPNQADIALPLEFSWKPAEDPDPGDAARYTLYLAKDIGYTRDVKIFKDLEPTRLEITEALEPGISYYWKVLARDRKGLQAWSSLGENKSGKFTVAPVKSENTGDLR
jgi:hypothetical protein